MGGFGNLPIAWNDETPVYNAGEVNPRRPSVYVSLEPYNNNRSNYDSVVSLTGIQRDAFGRYQIDLKPQQGLDFDNAVYFNKLYGHQEAVLRDRVSEGSVAENANFEPGSSPIIAFAGCTKYWNPRDQDYTFTTAAQGFIPTAWYGKGLRDTLQGKLQRAPAYEHIMLVKS
jgi:hypothetical protein